MQQVLKSFAIPCRRPLISNTNRAVSSYGKVDDLFLSRLAGLCDNTTTNKDIRHLHGNDESSTKAVPPDVVAFPKDTETVQGIVRLCSEFKVPIIPYGAGTSLEGHITALHGGVSLDMTNMDAILEVNMEDMDARVQAGVTRNRLNEALRHDGLAFMVDPGADASLGGMTATGASGTAAVRYGTMRESVLGLSVVDAHGNVVKTGSRARKSSAGYDLTRLFIGSEGTLGVITEVQTRLFPQPTAVTAAICSFDSVADAASAATYMLQMGIPVARCELLDKTTIAAFNKYAKNVADMEVKPHLFLEFHGPSSGIVEEQAFLAGTACNEFGGHGFNYASSEEERKLLWAARHATYYAACALGRPESRGVITDACVPLTKLAEIMEATAKDVEESGVIGPMFGHAGDGNFHCILVVHDDDDDAYTQAVKGVSQRLIKATLAAGGTCTGEHGVGSGKKKYLLDQYGEHGLNMMRTVKTAFDPLNIFNPGKIFDM